MILLLLTLIVVVNKYLYKSFLNPIFLQSLLWLFYYVVLLLNIDKYNVYIEDVTPLLLLQITGFSLGGFLKFLFTKREALTRTQSKKYEQSILLKNVKFCYPFVLTILIIALVLIIRQAGSTSITGIADLRSELVEDDGKKFGLLGTIQYLLTIYLLLYFATGVKLTFRYIIFLVFYFYFTLLLGSRGMFLFFFSGLVCILLWQQKVKKMTVFSIIIVLFAFFLGLTFLRSENDGSENFLLNMFLVYTVTSLPALLIAPTQQSLYWGAFTFRNIYLWLNKLGLSFIIVPILSEFIDTPLPTNVYTYIKPYYYDFGNVGVFIIPLFLGFLHNTIYFNANKGKVGAIVLMALSIYPLVMQIFDEFYFIWFSNWLYFIILILVFTKFRIYELGSSRCNLSPVSQ